MSSRRLAFPAVALLLTTLATSHLAAEENLLPLGDQAQIKVPQGFVGLDGQQTQAMLRQSGEPTSGKEVGMLAPQDDKQNWSLFFDFDPIGYVKDDEKDSLDPDAILESIKLGTEAGNEFRRKQGGEDMIITGWHTKPTYNPSTKNLEWCVAAKVGEQPLLNYNIRMLGRHGVMEITLVTEPASLDKDLPQARTLLDGFQYKAGNTYAEWQVGDKVAEYGLAALIAGGAAAVALKSGLLQKLLKPLIIGVLALGGFLAKLFGRRKTE